MMRLPTAFTEAGIRVRVAVVALTLLLLGVAGAPSANAAIWTRCAPPDGFPPRTLSVSAMTCADGLRVVPRLFRDNPRASSTPFRATRRFRTKGRTRGTLRRLTCSVRYSAGTGNNRGGIQLTIRCRDYRGDGLNYTEQQDNA